MVFMLVFLLVCATCEDGFFFLQLLPGCCWRCHVMSIMGSPSCLEPELVASAFVFLARSLRSFLHLLFTVMLWSCLLASLAALSLVDSAGPTLITIYVQLLAVIHYYSEARAPSCR